MSAPAVSVVIPCYNLGAFLDQAVQSVLDQTTDDVEILVVDDGSTDEATRLLFASYRRPRMTVFRTENQGLARSRNFGLQRARGRFVCFLDADDLLEPTFLEKAITVLERDERVAFVSCWLEAFGEMSFDWTPESCDFPVLLSECTVCTASLQRRDAVLTVGGYDPEMPVPGYEDWDLAISLVESGQPGVILREPLFRYRIRKGSMCADCTEPANHLRLLRYMIDKHRESYRRWGPELLEITEERTARLGTVRPWRKRQLNGRDATADVVGSPPTPDDAGPPMMSLESVVARSRPGIERFMPKAWSRTRLLPLTIVINAHRGWTGLPATLAALQAQSAGAGTVVVVETPDAPLDSDGRRAAVAAGARLLQVVENGASAARRRGLEAAATPFVLALDAGDVPHPDLAGAALPVLQQDPAAAFVSFPVGEGGDDGFVWTQNGDHLLEALAAHVTAFPVLRKDALSRAGGYAADLPSTRVGDRDLAIRLSSQGFRGVALPSVQLARRPPAGDAAAAGREAATALRALLRKHRLLYESRIDDIFLFKDTLRRRLEVHRYPLHEADTPSTSVAHDWSALRRVEPVSRVWGIDRGQPIDRYYIDRFLSAHRSDIRGRVLEVKDATYTRVFGSGVERVDVLDIVRENPDVTLLADLEQEGSLPENAYDCVILTQTIHLVYDIRTAVRNAARTLTAGGILLATLPCVSRIDYEPGVAADFWRFTPASARQLFDETFAPGKVEISAVGNVLACCSFLMGLASHELAQHELDHRDPYFPLLVCVRAVKAGGST